MSPTIVHSSRYFDVTGAWRSPRALALICVLAAITGALATRFTTLLLPMLGALAVIGLLVFPLAKAHARASGYFVAAVILFGVMIEVAAGHSNVVLTQRLRLVELVMMAVAALAAASLRRRPLPLILLITPVLLALVDVAAFVNVGFARVVLTGGLNLYLHYFVLAIFVYYSDFGEREMRGILIMVGTVFVGVAVIAVVQSTTGRLFVPFVGEDYWVTTRAGFDRAVGIFTWPTEIALFAGAWFFLFYIRAGRSGVAAFYSLVCLALATILLLSVSRVFIAAIVSMLLVMALRRLSRGSRIALCGVLIAVVGMFALVGGGAPLLRSLPDVVTTSSRYYYLSNGVAVWRDNPVVGVGFNRYATDWSADLDPAHPSVLEKYDIAKVDPTIATTDSLFVSLLPELGLVGSAVVIAFVVLLLPIGSRWRRMDPPMRGYALCLVFISLSAIGSGHSFFAPHTLVLWIAIGMLARLLHAPIPDGAAAPHHAR